MLKERFTTSSIESTSRTPVRLPGVDPLVEQVRRDDWAIKLFYAEMRLARESGRNILDIGSTNEVDDSELSGLNLLIEEAHQESLTDGHYIQYASSWGTIELRRAISTFFARRGVSDIDPVEEVMVTRGIIDSVSKVIKALDIDNVIIPSWSMYFARSHAILNGKSIIEAPLDLESGNFDLQCLEDRLEREEAMPGRSLMYMTHPACPTGNLPDDSFIEEELIPFLKENGIALISDSYISSTTFSGRRIRPILSYEGAKEVAVEAITVSKEIGLPGARAGGIAGNAQIINAVRLLVTSSIDIIPETAQHLAARALLEVDTDQVGRRISREFNDEILPKLQMMGWPRIIPEAGIDFLVEVPHGFIRDDVENPSLLASFSFMRRFGVAFCPASVFNNVEGRNFLRIVLKQKSGKIPQALQHLEESGFDWMSDEPNVDDVNLLQNRLDNLDLTRL